MYRKARIDAMGALPNVIVRGIERRKIFYDDEDRDAFVEMFAEVLSETHTDCFAWALIPNHAQCLVRAGLAPISTAMRRLLTGYTVHSNRRHRRHGHVFQNRYKSNLGVSQPTISQSVKRGERIVKWKDLKISE
jgi:putative transposase